MQTEFHHNTAICCCSQDEVTKLLELLDKDGWRWMDGSSLLEKSYYQEDRGEIVYSLNDNKRVTYSLKKGEAFKKDHSNIEFLWFGDEYGCEEDQSAISDWLSEFKIVSA